MGEERRKPTVLLSDVHESLAQVKCDRVTDAVKTSAPQRLPSSRFWRGATSCVARQRSGFDPAEADQRRAESQEPGEVSLAQTGLAEDKKPGDMGESEAVTPIDSVGVSGEKWTKGTARRRVRPEWTRGVAERAAGVGHTGGLGAADNEEEDEDSLPLVTFAELAIPRDFEEDRRPLSELRQEVIEDNEPLAKLSSKLEKEVKSSGRWATGKLKPKVPPEA